MSRDFSVLRYDGFDWYFETPPLAGDLSGIWAASLSAVVLVENAGAIAWFDGDEWDVIGGGQGTFFLSDVWGAAANDVFAVGRTSGGEGFVRRFNGVSWTDQTLTGIAGLQDVGGFSGSDVFAVGVGGTIVHFDGFTWSPQTSGVVWRLNGVWGSSPTDVFAVGDNGVLHYNGTSWSPQTLPTTAATTQLHAVWGSSSSDVFAVGISGEIYRYNGTSWSVMESATITTEIFWDVWGTSSTDVFVVGDYGLIFHYNGSDWTQQLTGLEEPSQTNSHFYGIAGLAPDTVAVVGADGMLLQGSR